MFTDPQGLTYDTVAKTLPTIGRGVDSSTYRLDDTVSIYRLNLSHLFKPRRNRAVARLQRDSFAADPLVPTSNLLASMTATLTVDYPVVGLTVVDAQKLANCLVLWSSPANLLRLLNGET